MHYRRLQHHRPPYVALSSLLVLLGGCLDSGVEACSWGLRCPAGQVCHEYAPPDKMPMKGRCVVPCNNERQCGQGAICRDGFCDDWICGNKMLDPGEECDAGDTANYDGCTASCKEERFTWFPLVRQENDPGPPPLFGAALSHFNTPSALNLFILTGGQTKKGAQERRTWILSIKSLMIQGHPPGAAKIQWTLRDSDLSARRDHAVVYDTQLEAMVLHGGQDTGLLGDTWVRTAGVWTQAVAGPKKRSGHAMVWDESLGKVLVFGGASKPQPPRLPHGDLWTYDATQKVWTLDKAKPSPPARHGHVMIYDTVLERSLVIGGITDHVVADRKDCYIKSQTQKSCLLMTGWSFDGAAWKPMGGPHISPGRWSAAGAYNQKAQHAVVFGGITTDSSGKIQVLDDLWLSTSDGWKQVKRLPSSEWPRPRHGHTMVSMGALGAVLMYGGKGEAGETLDDLWLGIMYGP